MKATVIIPTTGSPEVRKAIESVLNQDIETQCYLICDGKDYYGKVKVIADEYAGNSFLKTSYLPINVGANGFYGHRVYAAFTHLINTEYVMYLDQDCWFEDDHVRYCIETIEKDNLDWSYSLRRIVDKEGKFICNDDCESLGKWPTYHNVNHIDTNSYCLKTDIAVKIASSWHGGWGQDRVVFQTLNQYFPRYHCSGQYTVNYRVDGNPGSVNAEFFLNGNKVMRERFGDMEFPWAKI